MPGPSVLSLPSNGREFPYLTQNAESPPAPIIVFEDDFTGVDGTNLEDHTPSIDGTAWTLVAGAAGDVKIKQNTTEYLPWSTAWTAAGAYLSDDLGSANHYIETTVPTVVPTTPIVGCYACVRLQDENDWAAGIEFNNTNTWRIRKSVAGTLSTPTADSGIMTGACANGDVFRLEISGNELIVLKNTVEQGRATITEFNTVTRQGLVHAPGIVRNRGWTNHYKAGTL